MLLSDFFNILLSATLTSANLVEWFALTTKIFHDKPCKSQKKIFAEILPDSGAEVKILHKKYRRLSYLYITPELANVNFDKNSFHFSKFGIQISEIQYINMQYWFALWLLIFSFIKNTSAVLHMLFCCFIYTRLTRAEML